MFSLLRMRIRCQISSRRCSASRRHEATFHSHSVIFFISPHSLKGLFPSDANNIGKVYYRNVKLLFKLSTVISDDGRDYDKDINIWIIDKFIICRCHNSCTTTDRITFEIFKPIDPLRKISLVALCVLPFKAFFLFFSTPESSFFISHKCVRKIKADLNIFHFIISARYFNILVSHVSTISLSFCISDCRNSILIYEKRLIKCIKYAWNY